MIERSLLSLLSATIDLGQHLATAHATNTPSQLGWKRAGGNFGGLLVWMRAHVSVDVLERENEERSGLSARTAMSARPTVGRSRMG